MSGVLDGVYWESSWPLSLKQLIDDVLGKSLDDPNMPTVTTDPGSRFWFSQPRPNSDATTEVLTVTFKVPLSLSEIGFEVLRVAVRVEVWYRDTYDNWRQALDRHGIPVSITLQPSAAASWYKFHTPVYPLVAKAIQLRCTRVASALAGTDPYMVGIRNTLLRRNIYQRNDGLLPMEDELDAIGNVVSKYIKDWDATRAIDGQALTFWRSAPQPDHQAVASLYLDYRQPDGSPQTIDGLVIDPVYTGQTLNLYYSNDETTGTRKLSSITLPPDTDENTDWRPGRGRRDIATGTEPSAYHFPFRAGHLVSQDTWLGVEWTPNFDPSDGPPLNPVLLEVLPEDADPAQWWPILTYDSGAGQIVLTFTNGTDEQVYAVACNPLFAQGTTLRILAGWEYDPKTVTLVVCTSTGIELGRLEDSAPDLPTLVTLDGQVGFSNFRGTFAAHVIKLEGSQGPGEAFLANPQVYTTPDPVLPDAAGNVPSTTLDNAIYAVNWLLQEHGTGGAHDSFYEYKTWTPIWRDYLTVKGRLAFPNAISMRYLKAEFTNLNEEPYPVYDSGIETTYKVYPLQVQQMATVAHPGLLGELTGTLALWGEIALGAVGIGSVNWLNPSTVARAVDAIFGTTVSPVTVTAGTPATFSQLPTSTVSSTATTVRTEAANPYVYKRMAIDAKTMASYGIIGFLSDWVDTAFHSAGTFLDSIGDAFSPVVNLVQSRQALPVQGRDWWVFPGATLSLPARVMEGLTAATQVVLGRKPTTETRMRFTTTSVHRYDTKTVTRDAALAYFAGIREIRAVITSYIDEQDPDYFTFDFYDPTQWVFTNVRQLDTGPITTSGDLFTINNYGFDLSDANWLLPEGQGWERDPAKGHWHWGSLSVQADGTEKNARSSLLNVTEGDTIRFTCWAAWEDLVVTDHHVGLSLGGTTYLDGEAVADIVFDEVNYDEWTNHGVSFTGDPVILDLDGGDMFRVYSGWSHFTVDGDGNLIPGEDSHLVDDGTGMFIYQDIDPHEGWVKLTGTWTCPAGVDQLRVRLSVTEDATAGRVWFDTVTAISDGDMMATIYREFVTTSTFAKVRCDFRDSGMVRSDAMWARVDPLATGIDNLALAYYVSPIPERIEGATWADTFATWSSSVVTWGAERAQVAVSIDPSRIFDGRRALRMTRVSGAGEGGVKILQQTNMLAGALARLCVVFYKPVANNNSLVLRLRRESDGVYVHEEVIHTPTVGYWYTYQGQFFDIPDGDDQVYTIEVVSVGDAEDEIFFNDLYTDLSHIRYFIRLGGAEQPLQEVTALRYAAGYAQVVTSTPVNSLVVQAAILSPRAFAYGCTVFPQYLK